MVQLSAQGQEWRRIQHMVPLVCSFIKIAKAMNVCLQRIAACSCDLGSQTSMNSSFVFLPPTPSSAHATQENVHANTGTAHVCTHTVRPPVRVCCGKTSSVVPPWTRTGSRTAWVQTWLVPVRAHVHCAFFLCPLLYAILLHCLTEMTDCDDEHRSRDQANLDSREYDTIDNSQYGLPHVEGNTPTRADLEGGDYSDPRYHGEVSQERGSSTDCTNPQTTATADKNGYTRADVYGSVAAAPHINTPTRADLEAKGYSDPRYYGD